MLILGWFFCRCEKEEDLAMIAAQQYYVEYGGGGGLAVQSAPPPGIDPEKLYGLLPNYIPDYCLQPGAGGENAAAQHWHSLIIQAYQKVYNLHCGPLDATKK